MSCHYTYTLKEFVTPGDTCNCRSLEKFRVHVSTSLEKPTDDTYSRSAASTFNFLLSIKIRIIKYYFASRFLI